nr:phasin family protein [Gammaproteobacteria bacterium]
MKDNVFESSLGEKTGFFAADSGLDGQRLIDHLTALVGAYTIPGLDIRATLERNRKDLEALAEANSQVFHGIHIAMAGEGELLSRTVEQTIQAVRNVSTSASLSDIRQRQIELLIEVLGAALATMREMAESIAVANREAFETINRRLSERASDMHDRLDRAAHLPEEDRY